MSVFYSILLTCYKVNNCSNNKNSREGYKCYDKANGRINEIISF